MASACPQSAIWGEKIKSLSGNVKRSLFEGWRDCLFDRKPAACHHKPVISQSMWVGDLFRCRHSSHFVLQRREKRLCLYNFLKEVMLLKRTWKADAVFLKRREQIFLFPRGGRLRKEWGDTGIIIIYLFLALIHQVQKLNHANALSNYCHGERTPTFNAVGFIVKRQQIISAFHFLNVPN